MRLILLGPPGAGKGTQATILSQEMGIPHISTGDILREVVRNNSPMAMKVKGYMDKGELVPDDLVIEIMTENINRVGAKSGFILDGFPRTQSQAKSLDRALAQLKLAIDAVVYFETSTDTIIHRLSGRRVCSLCGAIYHVKNMPPKAEGTCDRCGGGLILRDDDKEETVRRRLKVYEEETSDLIDYYRNRNILRKISGDLEASQAHTILLDLFTKEKLMKPPLHTKCDTFVGAEKRRRYSRKEKKLL